MAEDRLVELVEQYKATTLYRALHAEVSALIAEANSPLADASDPYKVMRLRGQAEAWQRIVSAGFLFQLAGHVLASAPEPTSPLATPHVDTGWWETDRHPPHGEDLVS